MEENKKDIKEILELLDAVQVLLISVAKITKDGKVDFKDLPILFGLLKETKVIVDGIKGIKDIPSEIKDLDQKETIRVGLKIYEIVHQLKQENKK